VACCSSLSLDATDSLPTDYAFKSDGIRPHSLPTSGNLNNLTLNLDTSNVNMPNFTFTNGSKFGWVNASAGKAWGWEPLAEGVSRGKKNSAPPGAVGVTAFVWVCWAAAFFEFFAFL
jgi:hypothetical protein